MTRIRNLMAGLLLAVSATVMADDFSYLTITATDGESSYEVSNIERITFDSSNLIMHLSNGTEERLPLANLSKMFFSDTNSGIATVQHTGDSSIQIAGGVLKVTTRHGAHVTLYNIGGMPVKDFQAPAGESEVSIAGLRQGVYIVKMGNQTQKFMQK